jgi:hypothetical protein
MWTTFFGRGQGLFAVDNPTNQIRIAEYAVSILSGTIIKSRPCKISFYKNLTAQM